MQSVGVHSEFEFPFLVVDHCAPPFLLTPFPGLLFVLPCIWQFLCQKLKSLLKLLNFVHDVYFPRAVLWILHITSALIALVSGIL